MQDGDRIAVYPVFESLDVTPLIRLRPVPLRNTKFSVDGNLTKLAQRLRLLGFDTLCETQITKKEFINQALREKRIILTADKMILMQNVVTHGYFVRAKLKDPQIEEVLKRFDLYEQIRPFTRCMVCNGLLKEIRKNSGGQLIPENVYHRFDLFLQCLECKKIYWHGTHHMKMQTQIKKWLHGK